MNEKATLTQESLETFLASLDSDRSRAAEKYESLHRKLVKCFQWRGSAHPEELADETVDRVSRRILEGEEIRDLPGYLYGVARNVLRESWDRIQRERTALENAPPLGQIFEDPEETRKRQEAASLSERRWECLRRCLERLPPETGELILRYYQEEKGAKIENRKELADRLGIALNALRIRACRIREKLETCVRDCMLQREKYIPFSTTPIEENRK